MRILVDNILVEYEILGGKDPKGTMVILHGWGRSKADWRAIGERLSIEKRLRVILVDLPGFGGSSVPNQVIDTFDYSDLILDFLKKIDIKEYLLLGHSFGGKVSIVMASKTKSIERLFLVSPSGVSKNYFKAFESVLMGILKVMFPWILPKKIVEKIASRFRSDDYKNSGEISEIFKKVVNQIVIEEAKNVSAKTVIIWGSKDNQKPLSDTKKLSNLIPDSTVRVVWGAGHNSHIEDPNTFFDIISDNLTS